MVTSLLDTSIVIDLIRKYAPAQTWIASQTKPGATTVVWLEVLQGAQNKPDQEKSLKILRSFERVEVTMTDVEWTIQALLRFRLSHNVMAFDALIASVSYRLQVPLFTRNIKHFAPLLGGLAQVPY